MNPWTRWLAACLAVAGSVALALGAGPNPGAPAEKPKRTAEDWRKLYPFESVAGRLAYEARTDREAPPLGEEASQRLEQVEKAMGSPFGRGNLRAESLKKLHSAEVEDFIRRDGFGLERTPRPATRFLELADAPSISFPSVGAAGTGKEAKVALAKAAAGTAGGSAMPSLDLLGTFHVAGEFNFLQPASFGYVKDREHVAGFRPHQFRGMPELIDRSAKPKDTPKDRWLVRRLELVSLLKHDKPIVYLSDRLPRMDDLRKAETRPLTAFEDESLGRLRKGEDLVAEATTRHIRMVGSLRAAKQCLECHHGRRGDLLGCFSYDLDRVAGSKDDK